MLFEWTLKGKFLVKKASYMPMLWFSYLSSQQRGRQRFICYTYKTCRPVVSREISKHVFKIASSCRFLPCRHLTHLRDISLYGTFYLICLLLLQNPNDFLLCNLLEIGSNVKSLKFKCLKHYIYLTSPHHDITCGMTISL